MKVLLKRLLDRPYSAEVQHGIEELARRDRRGRHHIVIDAAEADAILFVDLHLWQLYDPFMGALREHELVCRYPDKVAVYDERDRPIFTLPGAYASPIARQVRTRAVAPTPYLLLSRPAIDAGVEPDLLFSFRGMRSHPLRKAVLDLRHPRGVIEDSSQTLFLAGDDETDAHEAARARYAELLGRSKFVLCPRGHGTSSYRLYETMLAGRVPVVISDAWQPPPSVDWDLCSVRIAERELQRLPERLEALEPRWGDLRAGVEAQAAEHLADDVRWDELCTAVEAQLERARANPRRGPWWLNTHVARAWGVEGRRRLRVAFGR